MRLPILILFLFSSNLAISQELKVIKYPDLAKIISEDSGKIKIINFWATWCGPCIKELPEFEALNAKFGGKEVEVILVSFDFVEQLDKANKYASKKNLKSILYLLDETDYNAFIDKVDSQWSGAIPATLMVDNRNNKRAFFEKEFKENELEKNILTIHKLTRQIMKKNVLLTLGVLAVAVIAFVNAKSYEASPQGEGYEVGSVVKDFKLKNIDGKMVSLADYKDAKGFIVVFTCNTCPYAKMYEDRVENLNKNYASKGYPVIAINPNDKMKQPGDSFDKMVARAGEKSYTYPYLYDETQAVATMYGATRTPHIYLLNKEGSKTKVAYIGAIDNNAKDASAANEMYVEDAIDNLVSGKAVENDFTKAIGCTIKWKEA